MKIVNCPNCNEEISNTANHCIYCGTKITFCPECEQVFANELEICPECGYRIKENVKREGEKAKTNRPRLASSFTDKWRSGNVYHVLNRHGATIANIIAGLFGFFAVLKFHDLLSDLHDLDKLFLLEEKYEACKNLLIFGCVFDVCSTILRQLKPYIDARMFSSWTEQKGLNLSDVINTSFTNNFVGKTEEEIEKESTELKLVIDADYYKRDILNRSKRIVVYAISVMIYVILNICFFKNIFDNVEVFIRAELSQSQILNIPGWSFSMIEWKYLVVFLILSIVYHKISVPLTKKYMEKIKAAWVAKKYKEHFDKYQKYIVKKDYSASEEIQ